MHLTRFKDAEQLRLRLQIEIADLVEEDGAADPR
jgi:hypothetical protein